MGDASAVIGIIRRIGLGKVRHLNTSCLWVQEKEASRELHYHKVNGSDDSADVADRVIAEARSGDIINIEDATNINGDEEHRLVERRLCDVVIVLLLESVSVHDDHFGAYDKQGDKK